MANEIQLILKVDDAGSLQIVGREAGAAASEVDKLGKSTDNVRKKQGQFHKGQKGVAGATANGTKAFSKMKNEIGGGTGSSGLVAAYATLAANVFAATAAFNALQRAAQLQTMINSLEILGQKSGQNLISLAESLRGVTDNAISMEQALKTAAVGTSAGFDPTTLNELAMVAKNAASALGRDVGDATDRLTRGVAKLEPEILDELGIIVRLDDAVGKYAAQLGVSADSLSSFQRTQAFANATIEQGIEKYNALNNQDVSGFTQLAATFQDLGHTVTGFISSALEPLARFLAGSQVALAGLIAVLSKGIINQMLPFLGEFSAKAQAAAASALGMISAEKKRTDEAVKSNQKLLTNKKYLTDQEKDLMDEIKKGNLPLKESQALQEKLQARLLSRQNAINNVSEKTAKRYKKEIENLKQQIPLLQQNIQLRKQQAGQGGGIGTAVADKQLAGVESRIMGSLDKDMSFKNFRKQLSLSVKAGGRYRKRMKEADTATLMFGKRIPFLSAALGKGGVAFKSFGLTARTALKGITAAIPIYGQLVVAFELVRGAISGVIEFFGNMEGATINLARANKAAKASIEQYGESAELARDKAADAFDKIRAQGTAIDGINKALVKSKKAQEEANKEMSVFGRLIEAVTTILSGFGTKIERFFGRLKDSLVESMLSMKVSLLEAVESAKPILIELQRFINAILRAAGKETIQLFEDDGKGGLIMLKEAKVALKEFQDQTALTLKGGTSIDAALEATGSSFNAFRGILEEGGEAATELGRLLGSANINDFITAAGGSLGEGSKLLENLNNFPPAFQAIVTEVAGTGAEALTTADLLEIFRLSVERGTVATVKASNAVQSLRSSVKDSGEEVAKFIKSFEGSDTALTKIINKMDPVVQSFKDLEGRKDGAKAIADELDKLPESLKEYLQLTGKSSEEQQRIVTEFVNQTKLQDKLIRNEKVRTDLITRQLNALKKVSKENTAGIEVSLNRQNDLVEQQLVNLQHQATAARKALNDGGQQLTIEEALNSGKQDLVNKAINLQKIENDIANTKTKELSLDQIQQKVSLQILHNRNAAFKIEQQIEKAKLKQLKFDQQVANIARGRGAIQTENELFEASVKQAELKVAAAKQEVNFTISRLELEKEILRMSLLARGIDEDAVDNIIKKQEELNNTAISGARAKVKAAETELKILKMSRNVSVQTALGIEKSVAGAPQIMAAVEKALSRFQSEVGAGSVLGIDKKALEEELQFAKETRDKEAAQGASEVDLSGYDEAIARIKSKLDTINAAMAQSYLSITAEAISPFTASLKELGTEGELVATIAEAAFMISSAWITAFQQMQDATKNFAALSAQDMIDLGTSIQEVELAEKAAKAAAFFGAVSQSLSAVTNVYNAASRNRIAGIQAEIDAEKKRDGKSAESVARLQKLEAKKESMARKQFETNKKLQLANAVVSTAAGVAGALSTIPYMGPFAFVLAGLIAAMGAAQIAIISGMSYNSGAASAGAAGPTSISAGNRRNTVDLASSQSSRGELAYMRGESGTGGPENFKPAFAGARYRAAGGETTGYVVGEQGPELFVPTAPGTIVPNDDMAAGAPVNATFNINTIDASGVEDILVAQRGNIIGMIREGANSYGQGFLEEVDTSIYTPSAGGVSRY